MSVPRDKKESVFGQVMWTEYEDQWWPVEPLRVADLGDAATPEAMGLEADVPPDEIEATMWERGTVPISFVGSGEILVTSFAWLQPLDVYNMFRLDENDLLSTEAIERTRAFWAKVKRKATKPARLLMKEAKKAQEKRRAMEDAGVVLPTSLLDALLRSVPAASVPPLLTATLLTPFLTANYHEKRKPSQTEAEKAARDVSVGGAALLEQRSEYQVDDAKGQFIAAATKCIQEHLRLYCRSTSDRVSISKAIIRLPTFLDVDGAAHHAQFEISTTNHTGYRQGDYYNSVETDEDWAVAIGCRCWSVHYEEAPDRKRPRDEDSARPASVWHPQGQREEYFEVRLESEEGNCTGFEDQSFEAKSQLKMLERFLSHTELGTVFDAPLLIQLAFALSQNACRGHDFEPLATFELNPFIEYLKELSCDMSDIDTEESEEDCAS